MTMRRLWRYSPQLSWRGANKCAVAAIGSRVGQRTNRGKPRFPSVTSFPASASGLLRHTVPRNDNGGPQRALIRLGPRLLDQLPVARDLALHEFGELLGRSADGFDPLL